MSRHRDFRNRQYSYDYDDDYYDDYYDEEEEDDEYYQEQERLRRERERTGQSVTLIIYNYPSSKYGFWICSIFLFLL